MLEERSNCGSHRKRARRWKRVLPLRCLRFDIRRERVATAGSTQAHRLLGTPRPTLVALQEPGVIAAISVPLVDHVQPRVPGAALLARRGLRQKYIGRLRV